MNKISNISPQQLQRLAQTQQVEKDSKVDSTKFSDLLKKFSGEVNELQHRSKEMGDKLVTGEIQDVHTVMLAAEEANAAFQMFVEIRNKLLEAYQEISRMQM